MLIRVCICGPSVAIIVFSSVLVRRYELYSYILEGTLIALFLFWGVRCASVVMMCTLLFSMVTGVILQCRGHTRQFVCPTPHRGGLRFGTAIFFFAKQVVPRGSSRSFRAGNGGWGARMNTLGALAVAKQTKPGNPMQAQVEPVVPLRSDSDFEGYVIHD